MRAAPSLRSRQTRFPPRSSPEKEKPLSPAVRHVVEEEKLEPEKIHGTGKGGRLTKADVLTGAQERGKTEQKIEAREVEPSADGRFIRKKMSPLRRKIAQQL